MAKDPAVLFYTADFRQGTVFFTDAQVGQYMRLLCDQHQNGHIPAEHMLNICLTYDNPVFGKFVKDANGFYYNERMEIEIKKRISYCESRRNNKMKEYSKDSHMSSHMSRHMDNGNDNDNKDIKKGGIGGEKSCGFEKKFEELWSKYPNKDGKKQAYKHFQSSVKSEADVADISNALNNYLKSDRVCKGYVKNGSTWFNNWRDWVVVPECRTIKTETPTRTYSNTQKNERRYDPAVCELIKKTAEKIVG